MAQKYLLIPDLIRSKILFIFFLLATVSASAQTAEEQSVLNTPKTKCWWSGFGGQGKKGGYIGTSLTFLSSSNVGLTVEASTYRERVTISSTVYNAQGLSTDYATLYTNRLNAYMCRLVKDFDLRSRLSRIGFEIGAGVSRMMKYVVSPEYNPLNGYFSEYAVIKWDRIPAMSAKIRYSLLGFRELGVEFAFSLYTNTSQTYWAGSLGLMIGHVRDPHYSTIKNKIM